MKKNLPDTFSIDAGHSRNRFNKTSAKKSDNNGHLVAADKRTPASPRTARKVRSKVGTAKT